MQQQKNTGKMVRPEYYLIRYSYGLTFLPVCG